MTQKRQPTTPSGETRDPQTIAVSQGPDEYKVGRGHPPREYQFKPGQSGNPRGSPKHRTNLWVYLTTYMAMTASERAAIDRTKLTAAQETALKIVEQAVNGKGCGFERLARYIVDREEGKAAEHIVISDEEILTDEECQELKDLILQRHASKQNDSNTD
jgi:hypothetical protein